MLRSMSQVSASSLVKSIADGMCTSIKLTSGESVQTVCDKCATYL